MEESLIKSLLSGDWALLAKTAAALVVLRFGAAAVNYVIGQVYAGLDYLKAKANETRLGKLTQIDDRFFDLCRRAFFNQANMNDALQKAAADGKIDNAEWQSILNAAFEDFKSNMHVSDWTSFAMALLGNEKAERDQVEAKLKARFMANARALATEAGTKALTARAMLNAPEIARALVGNSSRPSSAS